MIKNRGFIISMYVYKFQWRLEESCVGKLEKLVLEMNFKECVVVILEKR